MRRAALERPLMDRRLREDVRKHRRWGDGPDECGCTPGKLRKNRVYGCPKGRGCICHTDDHKPTMQELRARIEEREQRSEAQPHHA